MSDELEIIPGPLGLQAQYDLVLEVGTYKLKGYKDSEIAEVLDMPRHRIKEYYAEYLSLQAQQLENDPYFLERVALNTTRLLSEIDEISKEVWETVNIATTEGMVGQRTQALKLALDISTKRAQLLQLMSQKGDSSYLERTQKAEAVNQLLSNVLREVVSDCPQCSQRARVMLTEAFSLMETPEEDV